MPDSKAIEVFYDERPERRFSGEADYGVYWRANGRNWPLWRVSYIHATGEIYAVPLNDEGSVRVLGVIPPDPMSNPRRDEEIYYQTLNVILDGWADPDVSDRDLAWVERQLASYQPED